MIHVEPRDTVCVRATVVDVFPTDLAVEFGSASLMRTTLLVPRSSIVPVVEGETAGEVARLLVRQAERLLEMALRLQAEVAEVAEAARLRQVPEGLPTRCSPRVFQPVTRSGHHQAIG